MGDDLFGVRPIATAIEHAAKASVDGASAFLGRICLPVAEEFGELLRDKVKGWRARNSIALLRQAEESLAKDPNSQKLHAHPRLVHSVIEQGSWTDDRFVLRLWGGLLASSCTEGGRDEINFHYVTLLSQMTSVQARLLELACLKTPKRISAEGLILPAGELHVSSRELIEAAGTTQVEVLDIELDRLTALGLVFGTFREQIDASGLVVDLTATSLGMNMYVRCQGYRGSAIEFFELSHQSSPQSANDGEIAA